MIDAYASWNSLLFAFLPIFTSPSSLIFLRMAFGWVLCPGRRTITRIYTIAEPEEEKAHDAYHRFFRDGTWLMAGLWKILSVLLAGVFYRKGRIGIDLRLCPLLARCAPHGQRRDTGHVDPGP